MIISFVIAPLIAIVNYKLVLSDDLIPEDRPSLIMRGLSIFGIVYLLGFCLLFLTAKLNYINF